MNCPKCGAQIPDGAANCMFCGETLSAQTQAQPMNQPGTYGAAPVYAQTFTPIKKSNKKPIIIAAVSVVVLAAIAVALFVFILPNMGGVESKLKHRWSYTATEDGVTMSIIYDFKNNKMNVNMGMEMSFDIEWKVTGNDTLSVTTSVLGQSETENFKFKLGSGNKTLTLSDADDSDDEPLTFTRVD